MIILAYCVWMHGLHITFILFELQLHRAEETLVYEIAGILRLCAGGSNTQSFELDDTMGRLHAVRRFHYCYPPPHFRSCCFRMSLLSFC